MSEQWSANDVSLVLVPQHFGSIVYHRQTHQYLPFDRDATGFLTSLASTTFSDYLCQLTNPAERHAALEFYLAYYTQGFFTWDGRLVGTVLPVQPPDDHLTGPLTVHLEVTEECNLQCTHCFAEAGPSISGQLLGLHDLDRLMRDMARMGSFRLGLTGGEPLMRSDLTEIIDLAAGHGLSPCLTTNGLLLTSQIVSALAARPLAWLNVSLDGASPATHDAVRGAGTFQAVMERLRLLRDRIPFSLAFTVMRHNLHEIRQCALLARSVGAQAAVFRPLYPVGRARLHTELQPEFHEYLAALDSLNEIDSATDASTCSVHPWGPHTRQDRQSNVYSGFGCGAANLVCSVSARGDVSPCSFLGPEYQAGNLRQHTIREIWHQSKVFRQFRQLGTNQRCEGCARYDLCGGGCRARALSAEADLNCPDPWCAAEDTEMSALFPATSS